MKSSSGKYFIGLDHIRALAAFMVFTWHFVNTGDWQHTLPAFPLSLLSEGHTGVALFMTLSGYLFAKLLDGKDIRYASFFWNRFLRLAPLLFTVIILVGIKKYLYGEDLFIYVERIVSGIVKPTLPNGGWSITAEVHFYLLLPILLFLIKRWKFSLIFVLIVAIFIRVVIYHEVGQIQTLSYSTIVGRVDQFLLGIMAYQFRQYISGRHFLVIGVLLLFAAFYRYFDSLGGYLALGSFPSRSAIWIYIPTFEGMAYALAIAWYDNSFQHSTGKISRFVALIGTYSYSIYLLHYFVVFQIFKAINNYVIDLSNIYTAMLFSFLCFFVMVPFGYLSFRFIESPFLKFRTRYVIVDESKKLA